MVKNLTAEQRHIFFEEGTETPGSSPLNYEKREGDYHCAGCGTKLFESKTKYDSGSGWPSFFQALPDVFETKIDNLIGSPRTEYHCKKCGGHHGHIFDDGPKPTKREEMLKKSNGARTIPQIFIGEHHVGGNDELQALEREGKLNSLLVS